jgi:hypothetical protein
VIDARKVETNEQSRTARSPLVFLSTLYRLIYDRLKLADGIDAHEGEKEQAIRSLGRIMHYGNKLTE